MPSSELRVEKLARKMYEASDPAAVSWLRRGWTVRVAWLDKARRKLAGIVEEPADLRR